MALADESSPATFSFQKAKGKLGSAKEAIVDSTELGLSGPGAGVIVAGNVLSEIGSAGSEGAVIWNLALAGAAGGVTAVGTALAGPVVGTRDLIRSLKTVSPAELAQREAALTNALSQMAAQQPFHDALLQVAAERISGGFCSTRPQDCPEQRSFGSVDAVLYARVDDVRLERAGSGEGSYFLRIKTHARVVRLADGAICFEQPVEYRSGKALFLDWTLNGAIEAVAETGYQALAEYYVYQLLGPSGSHGH